MKPINELIQSIKIKRSFSKTVQIRDFNPEQHSASYEAEITAEGTGGEEIERVSEFLYSKAVKDVLGAFNLLSSSEDEPVEEEVEEITYEPIEDETRAIAKETRVPEKEMGTEEVPRGDMEIGEAPNESPSDAVNENLKKLIAKASTGAELTTLFAHRKNNLTQEQIDLFSEANKKFK